MKAFDVTGCLWMMSLVKRFMSSSKDAMLTELSHKFVQLLMLCPQALQLKRKDTLYALDLH